MEFDLGNDGGGVGGVLKTEARSDLEMGTPPSVCVHSQCSFA